MGWKRELTVQELQMCQTLGEIVIVWNGVEQLFRRLLHRATHISGPDGRIWSLIAHLTPVELKESMIALSHDHAEDRRDHLIHCAKLLDKEREYRNFYIHGPRTFWSTDSFSELVASSLSVRGGGLNLRQSKIRIEELTEYLERLWTLGDYINELLQDSIDLRKGEPLSNLQKPPIPSSPPTSKLSWWDANQGNQ